MARRQFRYMDYEEESFGRFWLRIVGGAIVAILLISLAVYAVEGVWLQNFEGPFITKHASNVRHGLNFTQAANQRSEGLISEWTQANEAGDTDHATALLNQICSAAGSINSDERYDDVRSFYAQHCGH